MCYQLEYCIFQCVRVEEVQMSLNVEMVVVISRKLSGVPTGLNVMRFPCIELLNTHQTASTNRSCDNRERVER